MFSRIINSVKSKEINSKTVPLNPHASSEENERDRKRKLPERNAYRRPIFLALDGNQQTECLDILLRPIVTTKDECRIPLGAGYAECINGGKSSKNEDQAAVGWFRILNPPDKNQDKTATVDIDTIDVNYFGIFDGHAGPGAALMAADQLINHLQENLVDVQENIFAILHEELDSRKADRPFLSNVSFDDLIVGALEAAFVSFDEQIGRERNSFYISGGCAAVVAIIVKERLYVAHAGDCRAVAYVGDDIREMAVEFTPETDSQRILTMANLDPSLTQNIFSDKIFQKNLNRKDVGSKVLFRAANHRGWQNTIITESDIEKSPLVIGQGKWAKLMGIIGVARGFGDHGLYVPNTNISVKPFLTPVPEVRILNLADLALQPSDVLVIGCDGLWDLLNNEKIKTAVRTSLAESQSEQASPNYNKAAESVVHLARGDNNGRGWKMADGSDASFDDINAFVIPLHAVCRRQKQYSHTTKNESIATLEPDSSS